MGIIITIDGPAGAGKSTVAGELAKRLGFHYINTGDLYRYITYCALKEKLNVNNSQTMQKLSFEIVEKYLQGYCNNATNLVSHLKSITDKIQVPKLIKSILVAEHSLYERI